MKNKEVTIHLAGGYMAIVIGSIFWFQYMDSSPQDPDVIALFHWLSAVVISAVLTARAFRTGTEIHKALACPLFLVYFCSFVFYMTVLQGTGRQ